MYKKLLATVSAIALSGAIAFGANLPLITGPVPAADIQSFLNQLIQSINTGVGGLINAQTAAVAASATNIEQTLQTYTLPGGTLSTAGQAVRVTCWGTTTAEATNATKTVKLYFGGTSFGTPALAVTSAQGFNWSLSYLAMRRSATTEGFDGTAQVGAQTTASVITMPLPSVTDAAETLANNIVIKCTGTNGNAVPGASSITANGMITELVK